MNNPNMKTKHTPGPWVVGTNGPNDHFIRDAGLSMIVDKINFPMSQSTANARLIAAAPELLEALEAVLSLYKSTGMSPEEHEVNRLVWNAVQKAAGGAE